MCACLSVNIFKLEYLRTSGPIGTKFYLNHHWGGGKAALGFGPDLVSMARDSSHRVIMGKNGAFIFDRIFFILAGNKNIHKISDELEIQPDRTKDCGVSCPWGSGKIPIDL